MLSWMIQLILLPSSMGWAHDKAHIRCYEDDQETRCDASVHSNPICSCELYVDLIEASFPEEG